jgi:hypothetical protein
LPHCLRELQWALDFASTFDKDIYVLPLHPCVSDSGISEILKSGVVFVHDSEGKLQAFKLGTVALDIVRNVKRYIWPSWCDLEPWTSDALGDLWPEQGFASSKVLRAARIGYRNANGPAVLVNELIKRIVRRLGASNRPCKIGDCRWLPDSDLEAIAISDDRQVPEGLADVYSEIYSKMCQKQQEIIPQLKRLRAIMDESLRTLPADSRSDSDAIAAASVVSASAVACEGVYYKSKSTAWPLLTLQRRCVVA